MKKYVYTIRGLSHADIAPEIKSLTEGVAGISSAEVRLGEDGQNAALTLSFCEPMQADERELLESELALLISRETGAEMLLPALADQYVVAEERKPARTVPLTAAVAAVITAIVIAVLTTFAISTLLREADAPAVEDTSPSQELADEMELIDRLFRQYSVKDLDDEAMMEAVLDAYVAATGDRYAEYFSAEEAQELLDQQNGKVYGIGVNVTDSTVTVDGEALKAILVVNVHKDSPADKAGILHGDAITYIGTGDDRVAVGELGYTAALNRLKGEVGTKAEFTVHRKNDNGVYETKEFSVERAEITSVSVEGRVSDVDPKVGVVHIVSFDNTTAAQLRDAMETLEKAGCSRYVFDLRNNPGGLLTAVEDVLAYFLEEGDLVISTKDKAGNEEKTYLKLDTDRDGGLLFGSGELTPEDVGRYKNIKMCVLVNQYTASAAELFTANVRDHGLGRVVGVTTYGKGSIQTTFDLGRYGYEGALKLTTRYYFPPSGKGYDGTGIKPDEGFEVALSEEAAAYNINLLPDKLDNQLAEAIRALG